jgi:predicted RNA-binding protein with PIN domain
MSLLLLIDGYNLSQPIAPSGKPDPRWLERNRNALLRDLAEHLSEPVRAKTCVVFDAANPPRDRPDHFTYSEMDVRFAVGYPTADDLLEEIIRAHHTPKRLMVVSSDHRVQTAARRRNARYFDSQPWIDALTDEKIHLAVPIPDASGEAGEGDRNSQNGAENPVPAKKPRIQDPNEVEQWMREFGFDEE